METKLLNEEILAVANAVDKNSTRLEHMNGVFLL